MATDFENWLKTTNKEWEDDGFYGELHQDAGTHAKTLLVKLAADGLIKFGDRGIEGATQVATGVTKDEFERQCKIIVAKRGEESTEWVKQQEDDWEKTTRERLQIEKDKTNEALNAADDEQRKRDELEEQLANARKIVNEQADKIKKQYKNLDDSQNQAAKNLEKKLAEEREIYSELEKMMVEVQDERDKAVEAQKKAEKDHEKEIETSRRNNQAYAEVEARYKEANERLENASRENKTLAAMLEETTAQAADFKTKCDKMSVEMDELKDANVESRDGARAKDEMIKNLKARLDTANSMVNAFKLDNQMAEELRQEATSSQQPASDSPKTLAEQLEEAGGGSNDGSDDGNGEGDNSQPQGPSGSPDGAKSRIPDYVLPLLRQVAYGLANDGALCDPATLPEDTMTTDAMTRALGSLLSALSHERGLNSEGMVSDVYDYLFLEVRTTDEGRQTAHQETEKIMAAIEEQNDHRKQQREADSAAVDALKKANQKQTDDLLTKIFQLQNAMDSMDAEALAEKLKKQRFVINDKKKNIKNLEEELQGFRSSDDKKSAEDVEKQLSDLRARVAEDAEKIKNLEEQLEVAHAAATAESQERMSADKIAKTLKENIDQLQNQIARQTKEIQDMKDTANKQERPRSDHQLLQNALRALDDKHDRLEDECDDIKQKLAQVENELRVLKEEHSKCNTDTQDESKESCDAVRKKLAELKPEHAKLKEEHAKSKYTTEAPPVPLVAEDDEIICGMPKCYERRMLAVKQLQQAHEYNLQVQADRQFIEDELTKMAPELTAMLAREKDYERLQQRCVWLESQLHDGGAGDADLARQLIETRDVLEDCRESGSMLWRYFLAMQRAIRQFKEQYGALIERNNTDDGMPGYIEGLDMHISEDMRRYGLKVADVQRQLDVLPAPPTRDELAAGAPEEDPEVTAERKELQKTLRRLERELNKHRAIYDNLVVDQTFIDRILTADGLYQPDQDEDFIRWLRESNRALGIPADDEEELEREGMDGHPEGLGPVGHPLVQAPWRSGVTAWTAGISLVVLWMGGNLNLAKRNWSLANALLRGLVQNNFSGTYLTTSEMSATMMLSSRLLGAGAMPGDLLEVLSMRPLVTKLTKM
jgi:DNA repair exonuclease SbcCD ATPase subunit